ncbi:hypothetical protein ACJ73_09279 [Blastomyces percursus]|uniref:Uncharacterized protein n=1 Tax=Blastomyces percursus TaxID=1658174 RepID=A0A1J9QCL1_9EURO|nr:hypothetical protein ACJ73_09279 [Blastomyces percursus]
MMVDSKLNRIKIRLRTKLLEYKRKRHFRDADTAEFNRQIHGGKENDGPTPSRLPELQIEERRQIVQLTCTVGIKLTRDERFARQCESITLWVRLQDRKEPQRRGRHKHQPSTQPDARPPSPMVVIHVNRTAPMKIYEDQCPFCASDMRLPDEERFKRWGRMNRLWDHIEKNIHREELRAYSSGRKPCGLCEEHNQYIPASTDDFKAHTWKVHNGRFRLFLSFEGGVRRSFSIPKLAQACVSRSLVSSTSSSQRGNEQTRKLVEERLFDEIRTCTHKDVGEFDATYFRNKSWEGKFTDIHKKIQERDGAGARLSDFPDPPT